MGRAPRRRAVGAAYRAAAILSAVLITGSLLWVVGVVCWRGVAGLIGLVAESGTVSTVGGLSGLGQAAAGSLVIVVGASVLSVPFGIGAGAYLSEGSGRSAAVRALRLAVSLLAGTPPIVVGVFVFALVVFPAGRYSMMAGMAALALLVAPRVARSTEAALGAVPASMREAAHALGATRWQVLVNVSQRAARRSIVGGALLAVARVGGETAPLLVTSRALAPLSLDTTRSVATLNVASVDLALRSDPCSQHLAWASALALMLGVAAAAVAGRLLTRGTE